MTHKGLRALGLTLMLVSGSVIPALAHDGPHEGDGIQPWHLAMALGVLGMAGIAGIAWLRRRSMDDGEMSDDGTDEGSE